MAFRILLALMAICFFNSCVTQELRMPSSINEVYKNSEMRQSLLLAAQNKVLFYIPDETLNDAEQTEVDIKCKSSENPFWAAKLSTYLSQFRQHPELFSKFHIFEFKKGDSPQVMIKKDLDQVSVLTVTYVKSESRGKVGLQTQLPCNGNLAEYVGKDITMTQFDFPTAEQFAATLEKASDRSSPPRLNFKTDFLTFLAERGALFKFNHELSFEKLSNGNFVMASILNQYADEINQLTAKNQKKSYINLWLKKINENSRQAELIQFFSIENDKELKTGIKLTGDKELTGNKKIQNATYLFSSFNIDSNDLKTTSLLGLNQCLETFTSQMGLGFFRKPAAENEKDNYLYPGFTCNP